MMEDQQLEFQAMLEAYQADLALAQTQAQVARDQLQAQAAPLPADSDLEVGAIAVRLPTFWTATPELWFAQT